MPCATALALSRGLDSSHSCVLLRMRCSLARLEVPIVRLRARFLCVTVLSLLPADLAYYRLLFQHVYTNPKIMAGEAGKGK